MKKRLLSLLLAVCMVAALVPGLTGSALAADDKVIGYLTSYTFKAGDTIYAVCQDKKIDFNSNIDTIGKINNITNYNYMMPGKVLWLPTTSATTDAAYYSLLSHTLVAGETPAALCQSYGIDYNANYKLLAALNNNLSVFMAGQQFILPIYVTPAGAATPTPSATTLPTATPSPATPAPDSSGTYTGTITEVTGSSITVGGISFGIRGAGITGTAKVGSIATVTYTASGGVYQASKVVVTESGSSGGSSLPGDTVSYYLAQHTLQYGETVSGVCAALGIDFSSNDATIRSINNISNYNYMMPGKVLLIPTKTVPTSGSYYKIMAHKIVSGDTVFGLCEQYGLSYYTYSNLITQLNPNLAYNSMMPGNIIYMPLYVAAATGTSTTTTTATATPAASSATAAPAASSAAATATPAASSSTVTAAAPTATPNIPSADTLSYLVIPHKLQYGETVSGICEKYGVDFSANDAAIQRLNGITSYTYLMPGRTILIPSTTYPSSGPYYKIMAHKLVAGDTVYDLCQQYGLSYENNLTFLQRLNDRDNLATYYVGQTIYMPLYVAG